MTTAAHNAGNPDADAPKQSLPALPAAPMPFGYVTKADEATRTARSPRSTLQFHLEAALASKASPDAIAVFTADQLKAALEAYGQTCAEHARAEAFASLQPVALLYSGLRDSPRQHTEWASVGETDHWPVEQWLHYKVEHLAVIPGMAPFDKGCRQEKTTSKEVVGMAMSPGSATR